MGSLQDNQGCIFPQSRERPHLFDCNLNGSPKEAKLVDKYRKSQLEETSVNIC